jgi:uncharacterized protein YbaR (Trm112 family)
MSFLQVPLKGERVVSQQDVIRSSLLSEFSALQAIVCCPRDKSPLNLMTISDLMDRLAADEIKRVPEAAVGAFVSKSSLTAYPIVGRVVDFLDQNSLRLSKTMDHADGVRDSMSESIKL